MHCEYFIVSSYVSTHTYMCTYVILPLPYSRTSKFSGEKTSLPRNMKRTSSVFLKSHFEIEPCEFINASVAREKDDESPCICHETAVKICNNFSSRLSYTRARIHKYYLFCTRSFLFFFPRPRPSVLFSSSSSSCNR